METKLLINQLTAFYPVGISISDEKSYNESVENQRKVKAINDALKDCTQWNKTKQSIMLNLGLDDVADYSFAAGYPVYYGSFRISEESPFMYSLFISVLLPYFCIRLMDTELHIKRFKPIGELEVSVFKKVSSIITSYFKDYELIDDKDLLEHQVLNIEFDYADPPTIADLLFTTIET
ncbi:hypothetical protein ACR782_10665 [Sphingobacterium spiritivorum]|uniref:hypothetical protein n=1 Tax=Sphingobacterium spiritivorum TaxID=258 RepID=UPI003DA39682